MKMNKRFIVITSKDEIGEPAKVTTILLPKPFVTLNWKVKEVVGVGVVNPRGIKKFTIVGDE